MHRDVGDADPWRRRHRAGVFARVPAPTALCRVFLHRRPEPEGGPAPGTRVRRPPRVERPVLAQAGRRREHRQAVPTSGNEVKGTRAGIGYCDNSLLKLATLDPKWQFYTLKASVIVTIFTGVNCQP